MYDLIICVKIQHLSRRCQQSVDLVCRLRVSDGQHLAAQKATSRSVFYDFLSLLLSNQTRVVLICSGP